MGNFKKAFLRSIKIYSILTCLALSIAIVLLILVSIINLLTDFGMIRFISIIVVYFISLTALSVLSAVLISKSEDLQ